MNQKLIRVGVLGVIGVGAAIVIAAAHAAGALLIYLCGRELANYFGF